ncbi:MAG: hypothetical protein ACK4IX_06560 [Candidatus Sericytochromatia bacterium]
MSSFKYKVFLGLMPLLISCTNEVNNSVPSNTNNKCDNNVLSELDKEQKILSWSPDDKKILFEIPSKYKTVDSQYQAHESGQSVDSLEISTLKRENILNEKEQITYSNLKWLNNDTLSYDESLFLLGLAENPHQSSVIFDMKLNKRSFYQRSLLKKFDENNFYFIEKDKLSNATRINFMKLNPISPNMMLSAPDNYDLGTFEISPDKTKAIVTYNKYSTRVKNELYILDLKSSKFEKLSKTDMPYRNIKWSTDNNSIYFEREVDECQNIDNIFSFDLKTKTETQITKLTEKGYSYDLIDIVNNKILLKKFINNSTLKDEDTIELVNLDGTIDKKLLSISGNYSVSLSNAKDKIAILKITKKDNNVNEEELSIINIDGSDLKTLLKI